MGGRATRLVERIGGWAAHLLNGPRGLALLSGFLLAGYWFGGEGILLIAGLLIPAGLALSSLTSGLGAGERGRDPATGFLLRGPAVAEIDLLIAESASVGRTSACFALQIDDFDRLAQIHGAAAAEDVVIRVAERLAAVTREGDLLVRLARATFAVIPAALRSGDLEMAIQVSARLQAAVAAPIALDAARIRTSASVGFVLARQLPQATGAGLLAAAGEALEDAGGQPAGAIRIYSPGGARERAPVARLIADVAQAFDAAEIDAWFQPQVSADTGEVTGFEALARWEHPRHGTLAPAEFLPAVAGAGRMNVLSTLMLNRALAALRCWQGDGLRVPSVSVNLCAEDLRDPSLPERVRWELDRFDLEPGRLCVEILETVLTPADDDLTTRNIARLGEMGVRIDLDDFGTGTASIAAIRRFAVHRLKIDRSFVTRVDRDRGQQDMVAAILSMAERLGLETLAEGVETAGEHAMLAQLGCDAVQGFAIAAPMPFGEVSAWLRQHAKKLAETRAIGRRVM